MSSAVSEVDAQSSNPAADAAPVAAITDLHVTFRRNGHDVHALRGVSLDIAPGEILGLVGESGSGKSVLGFTMLGLLSHARVQGSVTVAGTDMVTGDAKTLRKVRRLDLGAIFQDPMTSLNPTMRIGKQVAEAAGSDEEALKLLTAVGIPEPKRRFRAYPHELSGGLRQRVMIAIAIAGNPELIIADEPTTALDVTVQAQVLRLLQRLRDEIGCSIVLITHDLGVAAQISDRIAVLYAGRIAEIGPTAEVLGQPAHPYTHGLLRSRLTLDTAQAPQARRTGRGGAQPGGPRCRGAHSPRAACWPRRRVRRHLPDPTAVAPGRRQRLHRAVRSGVCRTRLAPDHHHRRHRAGSRSPPNRAEPPAVVLHEAVKAFGKLQALRGISLNVGARRIGCAWSAKADRASPRCCGSSPAWRKPAPGRSSWPAASGRRWCSRMRAHR